MFDRVRIIDLSVPLVHQAASEPMPASIRYIDHAGVGLAQMQQFFGVRTEDLVYSHGQGWRSKRSRPSRIPAPTSMRRITTERRARATGADHRPGAARVVFRARRRDRRASHSAWRARLPSPICERRVEKIDYQLRPRDIVLLQTGADKRIDTPNYFAQPGLGRDGTLWLVEQGVRMIGIDAYTLDRPFAAMVADYRRTGDGRAIWPAHFAGITREYCQIEKLANLDQIPRPHGFYVSCLPVKIERASAGWCRAVALVPAD